MPGRQTVDERTLAGWLAAPTESRAAALRAESEQPLIQHCDIEEHVTDPQTGVTRRCDATLSGARGAVLSAEMKRPEVMAVDSIDLKRDAHRKALARGFRYYATCNFRAVALWSTADGPWSTDALLRMDLSSALRHSGDAPARRSEIQEGWRDFLGALEELLRQDQADRERRQRRLPPQVQDLREHIARAGSECAQRLGPALTNDSEFANQVRDVFEDQFGVDVILDPGGDPAQFERETLQVATIACFVVASRLLLYDALRQSGHVLDSSSVHPDLTDALRVKAELTGLIEHAKHRTGDYELQLTPTFVDDVAFVPGDQPTPTGQVWARLTDLIERSEWDEPAEYVPGLYESLLTEEHRHAMGVHYTPDPITELIVGYAVRDAADVVLDPASGGGTFAVTAYMRKRALGASHEEALAETYACELATFAASLSSLNLSLADSATSASYPRVIHRDFFTLRPGGNTGIRIPGLGPIVLPTELDAVIGNPPYVRFEIQAQRSQEEADSVGTALAENRTHYGIAYPDFTGKADLYAFFIAHAAAFLRPGGRLGLIVSWSLLATTYGDRVLEFLARYFAIDALIDSKMERFFPAKTNTVVILARRLANPERQAGEVNPTLEDQHLVRFVRLKRPLEELVDLTARRGKRAEDLVDELLILESDSGDDPRWDVRVVQQRTILMGSADPHAEPADTSGEGNNQ